METMKYPNLVSNNSMAVNNGTHVEEVDSVYWQNSAANIPGDFKDTHMLMLDDSINNLEATINDSDPENAAGETSLDFDSYLLPQQPLSTSLAELKPLPPFAGYTANLSINGIQGHHYHAIAQRLPEEENNNNNTYNSFNDHNNIVSSSTCNVTTDSGSENGRQMYTEDFAVIKLNYSDASRGAGGDSKVVYPDCAQPVESVTIKSEMPNYDIASFEYIAAAIGSAMESADTTVPSNQISQEDDVHGSRESWMDLDAWVDGAFVDDQKNLSIVTQDGLSDFVIPTTTNQTDFKSMNQSNTSTLQSLLTHNYMPLLQSRLQNGPPIKQEIPSSTNYSTSSPPANVVSTTDNLMLTVNGRFLPNYGLVDDRNQSPDLIQNYPHTTTTTVSTKKPRSRTQKKQHTSNAYQDQNLGLLGKEKPVHRCTICNRGFLNKSNIKVHLRTHTGEKPFRCDTCSKAFRQKAHLLKHQQIHKRGGRD